MTDKKDTAIINDEQINLLEYGYKKGQTFEFIADAVIEIMQFASMIADSEEQQGYSHHYAKSKPKFHYSDDKTKTLLKVEQDFGFYEQPDAFFNQQPQTFHSIKGVAALDLESKMKAILLQHIKDGTAIKREEIGQMKIVENEDFS